MKEKEGTAELVALCVAGESEAWDRFCADYGGLIYSVIQRHGLEPQGAREIFLHVVGELWANGARRLSAWEGRSRFSTYLATVVSRIVADFMKGRFFRGATRLQAMEECGRGLAEKPVIGAHEGPRVRALRAECGSVIDEAMRQLPEDEAAVVKLFYWQGMTYSEIGILLGIGEAEVGKRLWRARSRLRELLGDRGLKKISDMWE